MPLRLAVLLAANALFPLAAAGVLVKFLLSPRRRLLLELGAELRERLGWLSREQVSRLSGREVIWIHAASAGEVAASAALVERLADGSRAILMTCSTASGRERARGLRGVDLAVMAPLDFFPCAGRFIHSTHPATLLIVETELWPHMIELCRRRGARIALVNGRLSEASFRRYRLFAPLLRAFLERIEFFAVQTELDKERFLVLGADPRSVVVTGNMKYDLSRPPEADEAEPVLKALEWSSAILLVAGSTHPGEEAAVVAAFAGLRAEFPELRLILAPRHPERAEDAARGLDGVRLPYARWSRPETWKPGQAAFLLDGLGKLPAFYALADVAFVGGTLVPVGGHNLLEPALAGAPVLFGPFTQNAARAARALESAGCGFCAADSRRLSEILRDLLADPRRREALGRLARETAEGLQGAVGRTVELLDKMI